MDEVLVSVLDAILAVLRKHPWVDPLHPTRLRVQVDLAERPTTGKARAVVKGRFHREVFVVVLHLVQAEPTAGGKGVGRLRRVPGASGGVAPGGARRQGRRAELMRIRQTK